MPGPHQINYDNDMEWHHWNRAAKTKIMMDNIAQPPPSNQPNKKQVIKSHVPVRSSLPVVANALKDSGKHDIIAPSQPPITPERNIWEDLNLFRNVTNDMEYAAVPINQDQDLLGSHSFSDSVEDFTVTTKNQV